jgi:hypothetical protein
MECSAIIAQLTVLKSDILRIQVNPPLRGLVLYQDRVQFGSASIAAKTRRFQELSCMRTACNSWQRVHCRKNPSLSGLVRMGGVRFEDCQLQ